MLLTKFGFRFFYGRIVRILISFVLIVSTLVIVGVGVAIRTYDYMDILEYYYVHSADGKGQDAQSSEVAARFSEKANLQMRYRHFYYDGYGRIMQDDLISLEKDVSEVTDCYALVRESERFGSYGFMHHPYEKERDEAYGWCYPEAFLGTANRGDVLYAPNGVLAPVPQLRRDVGGTPHNANLFYSRIACYQNKETLDEFGYELYGRLPESDDEVAIPYTLYQAFLSYGYRYAEDPLKETNRTDGAIEITSMDDILGKEIAVSCGEQYYSDERNQWEYPFFYAKIVGVISPGEESAAIARSIKLLEEDSADTLIEWNPCFALAVSRDFLERYCPEDYYDYITVSGKCSEAQLKEYFKIGTVELSQWNYGQYEEARLAQDVIFRRTITDAMAHVLSKLGAVLYDWQGYMVYLWVLVPFSMLLSAFTILSTLSGKKRNIHLLRSLGATKGQMVRMLLLPVLLFCVLCGGVALIGVQLILNGFTLSQTGVIAWFGGQYFPYTVGLPTCLAVFGIPLAMAAVSLVILFFMQEKLTQGKEFSLKALFGRKRK